MIEKKLTVHKEKPLYNMFNLISMTIEIYTTNIQIGTSYDENINVYWMGVLFYCYIFIRDRIEEENGGVGRSWHTEHVWCLNLTSICYSFWNKGRKVLKVWKFDEKKRPITPRWVIRFTSKL